VVAREHIGKSSYLGRRDLPLGLLYGDDSADVLCSSTGKSPDYWETLGCGVEQSLVIEQLDEIAFGHRCSPSNCGPFVPVLIFHSSGSNVALVQEDGKLERAPSRVSGNDA